MSGQLTLQLLGPLQITLDGQALTAFEYDKVRALMCYLVVEADRPHRREALAGLLWPEHSDQAARGSLRQALATLRQAIGDAGAEQPFLLITPNSVQFNPAAQLQLDVAELRALLAACDAHRHRRREVRMPCLQRLEQAASLYRGPFLQQLSLPDSAEFEKWSVVTRESLQRQALAALHLLAEYHARREAWPVVFDYAARQLALEPWREEACRQAMRALACDGQRSAALAQFQACAQALADELGVPPAAETIALNALIEAGKLPCAPAAGEGAALYHPPAETTRFIGRQAELAKLSEMLADPDCRLVTISGPGGVGKTRLAQSLLREAAPLYNAGAAFVPLAAVERPEGIVAAIAAALGLAFQPGRPEHDQLRDYLRPRELLLVLDNFEHLGEGRTLVADLLGQAARLALVVTSRHRLGLQAEWLYDLAGLAYPAADDDPGAADYPAVQLFLQRARQAQQGYQLDARQLPAVLRICRLTEGLPLAVELAAATIRRHTPAAIAERLAAGLAVLRSDFVDLPERQRSIEATLAYSWALLPAAEQAAACQMAVFQASFDAEAAQVVAGAGPDLLEQLVDKSWLRPSPAGRLSMHELLRQFAAEQNAAAYAEAQARHGDYYLRQVAHYAPLFEGEQASQALAAVRTELDNIRVAWSWTLAAGGVMTIEAAADGLAAFYQFAGLYREGAAAFGRAAERLSNAAGPSLMSRLRLQQGLFEEKLGRYEEALAASGAALTLAAAPLQRAQALIRLGHLLELTGQYGPASARYNEALEFLEPPEGEAERAQALNRLGNLYWRTSDYASAVATFQQALAADEHAGRASGVAQHLGNLGLVYKDMGEFGQAREHLGQALARAEALGHRENTGRFAQNLGLVYWQTGDLDRALDHYQRALSIARELDHKRGISVCLGCIGTVHRTRGEHEQALALQRESLQIALELNDKPQMAYQFGNIGTIYMDLRQAAPALENFQQALTIDRELGNLEGAARHLGNMGDVYKDVGEYETALARFNESLALLRQVGAKYYLCWVLVATAETLFGLGRLVEAAVLNEEGGRLAAEINRRDTLVDSEALSARLALAEGLVASDA